MSAQTPDEAARIVRGYHAGSSHHPARFAPGPGYLDWPNQPNPFREYAGAPRVELSLAGDAASPSWALVQRGAVPPHPIDLAAVGAFFELALGLTAWKAHGPARWALRANPSSGNLHPTEGYAIVPPRKGLPAGVYHYLSRDHVLERRFEPLPAAIESLDHVLGQDTFLLGLASIHWREAWKYGARAFRYCQHDAGHALAAARYAAAVLGWTARLLVGPGDEDVAALLGLDREDDHAGIAPDEREQPEALVLIGHPLAVEPRPSRVELELARLVSTVHDGVWAGRPNPLSAEHVRWETIGEVAVATRKPRLSVAGSEAVSPPSPASGARPLEGVGLDSSDLAADSQSAVRLIRGRRSAVDMDGETAIEAVVFFRMLARLLPRAGAPPWDLWPWPPSVHPLLFVHRVRGLAPGLYLLERSTSPHEGLRAALRPAFSWSRPAACPESVPLYLLEAGDVRAVARLASCEQTIASASAFAVAMIAEMGPAIAEAPWSYRHLHWEAGMLGHVLYLEAEAADVRGTGIGCFFDGVVHELLGLASDRFRDVYHFTVGGAVDDGRLTTLPAYDDRVALR